jgi:Sulfotransferase family
MNNIKHIILTNFFSPIFIFISKVLGNKKRENSIKNEQSFFILGSGRNGSTLLAVILNRHPNIFLPPEQYVLPYSIIKRYIYFFQNWSTYVKKNLKEYSKKNQNWILNSSDYKFILNKATSFKKEYRNPSNLFTLIYNYYGGKNKSKLKIVGDHSPKTTEFYKEVYHEFPNSKYIFLLRHPFDVILSYSKIKNHSSSNPITAAKKWNNSIKAYEYIKKREKENILLIRYEDLINEPQKAIDKVLSFLNMPNYDIIKHSSKYNEMDSIGAKNYYYHENLSKPIDPNNTNKWIKQLSNTVINDTSKHIKNNAIKYNYCISNNHK